MYFDAKLPTTKGQKIILHTISKKVSGLLACITLIAISIKIPNTTPTIK
jgi:hypothetical protein